MINTKLLKDWETGDSVDLRKEDKKMIELLAKVESWEVEYDRIMFGVDKVLKGGLA